MILLPIGAAFLLTWLNLVVFGLDIIRSLLITAIVFILAGFLIGERWVRRP